MAQLSIVSNRSVWGWGFLVLIVLMGSCPVWAVTFSGTPLDPAPATGKNSRTVLVGDLDNDGDPDIVTINGYRGVDVGSPYPLEAPQIFINDPVGTFTDNTTGFPSNINGLDGTLVDVNNDGYLDLVVTTDARNSSADKKSYVFVNSGNGINYTAMELPSSDGKHSWGVAAGDWDRDGDVDIFVANGGSLTSSTTETCQFFANNFAGSGSLSFAPPVTFPSTSSHYTDILVADLNRDGWLDVVLSRTNSAWDESTVHIFLNGYDETGFTGNYGDPPTTPVYSFIPDDGHGNTYRFVLDIAVADVNADGYPDLLFAIDRYVPSSGTTRFPVWLNQTTDAVEPGKFVQDATFSTLDATGATQLIYSTRSLTVGDFDNDGDTDLVAGGGLSGANPPANQNADRLYLNSGSQFSFDTIVGSTLDQHSYNHTHGITTADLNQDGDLDLVTGNPFVNTPSEYRRNYMFDQTNPTVTNTAPQPPTVFESVGDTLFWGGATDTETDSVLLTYNLEIRRVDSPGDSVIYVSGVNPVGAGNQGQINFYYAPYLRSGDTYYWRVQTVDTGFKTSVWSGWQIHSINCPDLSIPDPLNIVEDDRLILDLYQYVTDPDSISSWSADIVSGDPALIDIFINSSGIAILTPNANVGGETWNVRFNGNHVNPSVGTCSQLVTVNVSEVNDPPEFTTPLPDVNFRTGETASFDLDAYIFDVETDTSNINWTVNQLCSDPDFQVDFNSSTHVVTFSTLNNWSGSCQVQFTAADDSSAQVTQTIDVTAYRLTLPAVVDIPEDSNTTLDLAAALSPSGAAYDWTYQVLSGNTSLITITINGSDVATLTPGPEVGGISWQVEFTATGTNVPTFTHTLTVNALEVNDCPEFSQTIADVNFYRGDTYEIDLDSLVTDVDHAKNEINWTAYTPCDSLQIDIDNLTHIATFSVLGGWSGVCDTVRFIATDDSNCAVNSNIFTVTVTDTVNYPPVITPISDVDLLEDEDDCVSLHASDPNDDPLTWSYQVLSGEADSVNISIVTDPTPVICFDPHPNWFGTLELEVTVCDSFLCDSDPFTLTVLPLNDPPVVQGIPDITIPEDSTSQTLNLDDYVLDVDSPLPNIAWTYEVVPPSDGSQIAVSIDPVTHVVTFAPDPDWCDTDPISYRFTATDDSLDSGSDVINFTVTCVNDAPVIDPPVPDAVFPEETDFEHVDLDNYVHDVDHVNGQLLWACQEIPEDSGVLTCTIDPLTNLIRFSPAENFVGTRIFRLTVRDPFGATDTTTIQVTTLQVNDPPNVSFLPPPACDNLVVGGATCCSFDLDPYVSDIDHADSTMSWSYHVISGDSTAVNINIDPVTRAATICSADPDWSGQVVVRFTACDAGQLCDADNVVFNVAPGIFPPQFTQPLPDVVLPEDGLNNDLVLNRYITDDLPIEEISWTFQYLDATGREYLNLFIDAGDSNRVEFEPDDDWWGTTNIKFTARDRDNETVSDTVQITVLPLNDCPEVTFPGDLYFEFFMDEDGTDSLYLDDYVTDIDTPDSLITWRSDRFIDHPDINLTIDIDPNTHWVRFTPNDNSFGGPEYHFFTATDDSGCSSFGFAGMMAITVISVNDPPTPSLPDTFYFHEDTTFVLNLDPYVIDPDNTPDEMTWQANVIDPGTLGLAPAEIQIDNERTLHITPAMDAYGMATVRFTVTDDSAASRTQEVVIMVSNVNDTPVVAATVDTIWMLEDMPDESLYLPPLVTDADPADQISWTCQVLGADPAVLTCSITPTNRLYLDPQPDWYGAADVLLVAADLAGARDSTIVPVQVQPQDDPLCFCPPAPPIPDFLDCVEDGQCELEVGTYVFDPDGDTDITQWSYQITAGGLIGLQRVDFLPDSLNAERAVFVFDENWAGDKTIRLTVEDGNGNSTSHEVNIHVEPQNDPPFFTNIPDTTLAASELVPFCYTLRASDVDDDDLTLHFSDMTNLFDVDSVSGRFCFTPARGQIGYYPATVCVSDGDSTVCAEIAFDIRQVYHPADVDGNFQVDLVDVHLVLLHWGSADDGYDLTGDGRVDIADLQFVIRNLGAPRP